MDPSSTKTDISVVAATRTVRASTTHPEEEISSSRGLRLFFSSRYHPVFYPTTVAAPFCLSYSFSYLLYPSVFLFAFLFRSYKLPCADCRPRLLSPNVPFAVTNNRFRHEMSINLRYFANMLIFTIH